LNGAADCQASGGYKQADNTGYAAKHIGAAGEGDRAAAVSSYASLCGCYLIDDRQQKALHGGNKYAQGYPDQGKFVCKSHRDSFTLKNLTTK
jgi:hypothetical protein